MAYYPDLTPFEYNGAEPQPDVLNVGWLSGEHSFPHQDPDQRFVDALCRLTASPVRLYRGSHLCEFCLRPPIKISATGLEMMEPPPETRGNGEIHVAGENGVTYVAPVLILHYVTAHRYAPPSGFVEAALRAIS